MHASIRLPAVAFVILVASVGTPLASAQGAATSAPAVEPRPRVVIGGITQAPDQDERDAWLAMAVEETLTWRLRRVSGLVVVPGMRVHQARRELTEGEPLPTWERVASLLGGSAFLTGTCSGTPEALTIELRLTRLPADPGAANPGGTGSEPVVEKLPPARLNDALTRATEWALARLSTQPPDAAALSRLTQPPSESVAALEFYCRALQAVRADRMREAFSYAIDGVDYDVRQRPALLLLAQIELRAGPQHYANAVKRLRVLAELARINEDMVDRIEAELSLGIFSQLTGTHEAARTRFDTALALAQERNDPYLRLAALNALVDLLSAPSNPALDALPPEERRTREDAGIAQAIDLQIRVLDELQRLRDVVAEPPAANKLALLYERAGRLDDAIGMHRRTLAAAERCGGRQAQATAWMFIGQWQRRKGTLDEAVTSMRRCLELASESSRPAVHIALADIYASMNPPRWAEALPRYEEAYAALKSGTDLSNQLVCVRGMAAVRWEMGQKAAAIRDLQEAIDLAHALESKDEIELKALLDRWKAAR